MASNAPAACCLTGFKHEGTPQGRLSLSTTVNSPSVHNKQLPFPRVVLITTYVARPKNNDKSEKAVLLLGDVFGIFNNSKLLADDYAANGYLTLLPDVFSGDQMDIGDFEAGKIDIPGWLSRHGTDVVDSIVESVVKHMREELGVKKIAAAGYCFGGKYVTRFLKEGKIDVGYSAHPSFVSDEELGAIKKPFSISAAETDGIFTRELRRKSEDILSTTGQHYQLNLFSGVEHGFAIRADLSKPQNKYAKEQAYVQALARFDHNL
ncbi:uncharacterized protein N7511_011495 [Penicillium nucicola]|uniref:uncharacterized protein n=1 Tax=Penicillium nucicola TaxID=1850975 RepID=UPI00254525E6|nr:uncharacterized protein N7511_011495 [Penicillium nucicola]KAJ5742476.1 hypothetical protein N7511_011495 [Penicillium nucicola]